MQTSVRWLGLFLGLALARGVCRGSADRLIDGYDVLDRLDSDLTLEKIKKPEQIEKTTIVRR